ncbi:MAG TPA: hypothetical protein VFE58_10640 [Tepidisphaeraceae bacterium]|jgi:hypothetical protein|nr:hypothetical protein [Tepidisphaeraceae bacterium]
MILYAESNFLLELARQQEESASVEQLLQLAEARRIDLAFPVFALCEPFSTLARYGSDRNRFVSDMQRELRELGRLQPHKGLAAHLQPLTSTLLTIQRDEMNALETTLERILSIARRIDLTSPVFADARIHERELGLSPQDAIVYASILADLSITPASDEKCFVSRNAKDFDDPAITARLKTMNCRYISRFEDALAYATHMADSDGQG